MQLRSLPTLEQPRVSFPREESIVTRTSLLRSLFRPLTWLIPIWALLCGAISSGEIAPRNLLSLGLAILMVGPGLATANQLCRNYFERDLDAVKFPFRPIPSGRVSPDAVITGAFFASLVSVLIAFSLGTLPFFLVLSSFLLALVLNAPPVQLRRNSIASPIVGAVLGVGLPWILGLTLLKPIQAPALVAASIFTFGAIAFDLYLGMPFIEQDRRLGVRSLVAVFGSETGIWLGALILDTSLLGAAILCFGSNPVLGGFLLTVLALEASLQVAMSKAMNQRKSTEWFVPVASILFGVAMMLAAAATHYVPAVFM